MIAPSFGLVLCAGLGTRLRPLTDVVPKPLLHFFDRPIASWAVDALLETGLTRIGINAHAHAEQVEAWARTIQPLPARVAHLDVVTHNEPALLGTAGGARALWELLGRPDGTAIVINGDIVADFPLDAMLRTHRRTGAVATLLTIPAISGESLVQVDASGGFLTTLPLPGGEAVSPLRASARPVSFGGVYVLDASVFQALPSTVSCLIRQGVAPLLAQGATIAAHHHDGFWADLGTPARFVQGATAVLDAPESFPQAFAAYGGAGREDGLWVGSRAVVEEGATLEAPVFIADGARIEAGAQVGPHAVVGRGCVIRSGAQVRQAVLIGGADVARPAFQQVLSGSLAARAI
jgi:mannose-1-phosphate guanylyltransferase